MISANISQYIVSIYVLLAGMALTARGKDNCDDEDAVDSVKDISSSIFDNSIDNEIIDGLVDDLTQTFGAFASGMIADGACDAFTAASVTKVCNSTGTSYRCDPNAGFNYQCALLNLSSGASSTSAYNSELKVAVLEASGVNVTSMKNVIRLAMEESAESSVESLYPSAEYM